MDFKDLVKKNRSYRRFDQSEGIDRERLMELVSYARISPSGANRQPLKFHLSSEAALNERIFPTLAWAGYLKDWAGPVPGERPAAYITILLDKSISQSAGVDPGIAAQSITLGAVEKGLGACMIASVRKQELINILGLDGSRFEVLLVIALGKPVEQVEIEDLAPGEAGIEYWRDAGDVHHVPKRSLDELIL